MKFNLKVIIITQVTVLAHLYQVLSRITLWPSNESGRCCNQFDFDKSLIRSKLECGPPMVSTFSTSSLFLFSITSTEALIELEDKPLKLPNLRTWNFFFECSSENFLTCFRCNRCKTWKQIFSKRFWKRTNWGWVQEKFTPRAR